MGMSFRDGTELGSDEDGECQAELVVNALCAKLSLENKNMDTFGFFL